MIKCKRCSVVIKILPFTMKTKNYFIRILCVVLIVLLIIISIECFVLPRLKRSLIKIDGNDELKDTEGEIKRLVWRSRQLERKFWFENKILDNCTLLMQRFDIMNGRYFVEFKK